MNKIIIKGKNSDSEIFIGNSIDILPEYLPKEKVLVITDDTVGKLYNTFFPEFPTLKINSGEVSKNLSTIEYLVDQMLDIGVDRSWFILGFGGGVVCDIVGFLASIYMRGIPFGFVATTLLAQVDASVGGKNAVNVFGYKNIIGTFNQPKFVVCDPFFLKTLSMDEINCGIAEILKYGLISDSKIFDMLDKNYSEVLNLKTDLIEDLVYRSITIKASIVNQDEEEKNIRKLLNFGHTIAHILEKNQYISHGKAVFTGMKFATELSAQKSYISMEKSKKIVSLLKKYNFLSKYPDKETLISNLSKDKKKDGSNLSFVYIEDIGKAIIKSLTIKELGEDINELLKHSL
jgi:3-dehydroquinate synthase